MSDSTAGTPLGVPYTNMVCVVGRTASGKDTVVDRACMRYRAARRLRTYTTRDRRGPFDDGYVFVDDVEADRLWPDAVLRTEVCGKRYFSMPDDVARASIGILDPSGAIDLAGVPGRPVIVYLDTDRTQHSRDLRLQRFIDRAAHDGVGESEARRRFALRSGDEYVAFAHLETALSTLPCDVLRIAYDGTAHDLDRVSDILAALMRANA